MDIHATSPESSRFKSLAGAHFQRITPETIAVWRQGRCSCCDRTVALSRFAMSCDKDKWPNCYGLINYGPNEPPPEGYMIYSGGPIFCGTCANAWRKGELASRDVLRRPA